MFSKFLHLYRQTLSYTCEVEYTFYLCLAIFFLHCLYVNIGEGENGEKSNFFLDEITFLLLNNCIILLIAWFIYFLFISSADTFALEPLLQVFMDKRMRLLETVRKGRAASIWATVSFCCQSLIAKEYIHFSSRTGKYLAVFFFYFSQILLLFIYFFASFNSVHSFVAVRKKIMTKLRFKLPQKRSCVL